MKRIGIYAGTFDPVHAGHVRFALEAKQEAELDEVYFLPERKPRHKQGVEHFGHRVAMLNKACRPYNDLSVLEYDDISFTVKRTYSNLRKQFAGCQLVFLFGSDTLLQLSEWNLIDRLLRESEIVVAVREQNDADEIIDSVKEWRTQPKALYVFDSSAPEVASSKIRQALRENRHAPGALTSSKQYSNQNWLYVSLASPIGKKR